MIVASISTPAASARPISLKCRTLSVTNTRNTATITAAALVSVPAVVAMPLRTASSVVMPLSTRPERTAATRRRAGDDRSQRQAFRLRAHG
jgi:hypothetical protein